MYKMNLFYYYFALYLSISLIAAGIIFYVIEVTIAVYYKRIISQKLNILLVIMNLFASLLFAWWLIVLWDINKVSWLTVFWIVFIVSTIVTSIWMYFGIKNNTPRYIDWAFVRKCWKKYVWEWSNWAANWKWIITTKEWEITEWIFKNWKLNWYWKHTLPNWAYCEGDFVNWIANWECTIRSTSWNIYEWMVVKGIREWKWKITMKWLWEISWLFKADKPEWEHIIKLENWDSFKIYYENWEKVWNIIPISNEINKF